LPLPDPIVVALLLLDPIAREGGAVQMGDPIAGARSRVAQEVRARGRSQRAWRGHRAGACPRLWRSRRASWARSMRGRAEGARGRGGPYSGGAIRMRGSGEGTAGAVEACARQGQAAAHEAVDAVWASDSGEGAGIVRWARRGLPTRGRGGSVAAGVRRRECGIRGSGSAGSAERAPRQAGVRVSRGRACGSGGSGLHYILNS
jgi:hypothetical protein